MLVRSRRVDECVMPSDIADELLTLIGAGHKTTASALSWVFERLRRHPDVLEELVREVGGRMVVSRRKMNTAVAPDRNANCATPHSILMP
jgi:cytochrome P450